MQIEAKEELRARIGRSPDRADAVAMAFRPRPARWWLGAVECQGIAKWKPSVPPDALPRCSYRSCTAPGATIASLG